MAGTPKGITVVCDGSLGDCANYDQVDTAAERVASLLGITFEYAAIYILINEGPVELHGTKYSGLATAEYSGELKIRLAYTPCLFDGALVHELTHGALFLRDTDMDNDHKRLEDWRAAGQLDAELRAEYCEK